jgi:hypothetical protein
VLLDFLLTATRPVVLLCALPVSRCFMVSNCARAGVNGKLGILTDAESA